MKSSKDCEGPWPTVGDEPLSPQLYLQFKDAQDHDCPSCKGNAFLRADDTCRAERSHPLGAQSARRPVPLQLLRLTH